MAGSLNKVILIGNLGADPEVREFPERRQRLQPAHRHLRKLEGQVSGERKERTEWHTVAIFSEGLVGVAERYLRKGSKVYRRRPAADPQVAGPVWATTAIRPRSCCAASAAC